MRKKRLALSELYGIPPVLNFTEKFCKKIGWKPGTWHSEAKG
jgi:hypothetical protein